MASESCAHLLLQVSIVNSNSHWLSFGCYFVEYEYTAPYQALNDTVNTLLATTNELQAEVNVQSIVLKYSLHYYLCRLMS